MSDLNLLNTLTENWSNYPIAISVLIASVIGSSHCVTMCGPISILLKKSNGNIHFYNLGRLITYLFLGFVAGLFGEKFINNHYGTVSLVSTALITLVLIYIGVNLLRNKRNGIHIPNIYSIILSKPLKWIFLLNRYLRSLILGIINGFIPCGWLYVFVIASITLKNSFEGSLVMFFFWLGTVPSLTFLSLISNRTLNYLPQNLGKLAGIILILAGLFNIFVNFTPNNKINPHKHHIEKTIYN